MPSARERHGHASGSSLPQPSHFGSDGVAGAACVDAAGPPDEPRERQPPIATVETAAATANAIAPRDLLGQARAMPG
jgi:hypothetical protein